MGKKSDKTQTEILQKTLDAQFSKHKQKAFCENGGPQSPFLWHSQ
jgi:hypothetical protein